jgi:DNA-binding CsgD family transcriptional regulator
MEGREVTQFASAFTPSDVRNSECTDDLGNCLDSVKVWFGRFGVCVAVLDHRLRVLGINREFVRHFGVERCEAYGRCFDDFVHPSTRQYIRSRFARLSDEHRAGFDEQLVAFGAQEPSFNGELVGLALHDDASRLVSIVVLVKPESLDQGSAASATRNRTLSDTEARILEGVATGESTVRLASKLHLSRQGIEYHIGAMLRRFKVPNRAALASRAYSLGILCMGIWPPRVVPDCVRP